MAAAAAGPGEIIAILATGLLGLVPTLGSLFAPPADQITTVRIGVGAATNLADSLSGNVPGVALWDHIGRAIGGKDGTSTVLPQGNTHTVTIVPNATIGNIQPEYMSITNGGDDAICISFVTVTFPNGLGQSSFSGDIGKACGLTWFPSTQLFGPDASPPACMWIDRNDSNGVKFQGLGIHLPDFFNAQGKLAEYQNNLGTMCSSGPRFKMYQQLETEDPILFFDPPIELNPDGSDADPSHIINNPGKLTEPQWGLLKYKCERGMLGQETCTPIIPDRRRAEKPRSSSNQSSIFMEGQLVVSAFQSHSAQEVCESQTSKGPDFISLQEGLHCDMTTRKTTPVCSQSRTTCCFDLNVHMMHPCGYIRGSTKASNITTKKYHNVHHWTPPTSGTPESPSCDTPESLSSGAPESTSSDTPESTSTSTPESLSSGAPESPSSSTPESTSSDTLESTSTSTPESPATSTPESPASDTPESTSSDAPEST